MAARERVEITKQVVDAAGPAEADVWVWDGYLRGFGLRVRPNGRKFYYIQYRDQDGRTRRMSLGEHGSPWTAPKARERANRMLLAAKDGADPARERDERRSAPTVAEVCQRYLDEYAAARKKPRSIAEDRRIIDTKIVPNLGTRKLRSLTRRDVVELQTSLGASRVQTNRALALLSRICSLAERWELRPQGSNPCRGVPRAREGRRRRLLSADELARLGKALASKQKTFPEAVRLFRLLILTGCRLREIMTADWSDVDLAARVLHLRDSKTGARDVALNAPALAVLAAVPKTWRGGALIRGGRKGRAATALFNPYKAWERVCEAAGLEDLRLHDLRHAFASSGAAAGDGLPVIASLLGQAQLSTTERYSHLPTDPVRAASERIGERLWSALNAPVRKRKAAAAGSNVTPMRRRKG